MDDAKDAARWRAFVQFLRLEVEERSWWETDKEKDGRRTQVERREWYWHIEMGEEAWKLGATFQVKALVPQTLNDAIDHAIAQHSAAPEPSTKEKP